MNAQDFINSVATGNAAEAKDTLNNLLSARAFEALETKKIEIAQTLFGGYQVEEEVEDLNESDIENGYKIRMKHIDKGRIHAPSGEHVATVTREHGEGWRYHSGNKNWDGLETSKHYKTGVEKTKAAAAKKAVQAHMNEQVEQIDELTGKGQLPAIKKSHADAASAAGSKMDTIRNSNFKLPVPKEKTSKIYGLASAKQYHTHQSARAGALMKKAGIKE